MLSQQEMPLLLLRLHLRLPSTTVEWQKGQRRARLQLHESYPSAI